MSKRVSVSRKAARRFSKRHTKVRSINYGAGRGGEKL